MNPVNRKRIQRCPKGASFIRIIEVNERPRQRQMSVKCIGTCAQCV
jgi:hypothetical protein